jgi:hypothetical protein
MNKLALALAVAVLTILIATLSSFAQPHSGMIWHGSGG